MTGTAIEFPSSLYLGVLGHFSAGFPSHGMRPLPDGVEQADAGGTKTGNPPSSRENAAAAGENGQHAEPKARRAAGLAESKVRRTAG